MTTRSTRPSRSRWVWLRSIYDNDHRLSQSINALNQAITYDYDDQHRPIKVTDPLGHTQETDYNAKHLPIAQRIDTGSETLTTTSSYYPNGQVQTTIDGRGTPSTLTYDTRRNPDTAKVAAHPPVDRDHDDLGRLIQITDQEGAITQYQYDARGNTTKIIDPLGHETNLTYDTLGRLNTVTDRNNDTSTISYTPSGQIQSVDYPGTKEDVTFIYDIYDQVSQMTDGLGTSSYQYDVLGRLTQTTDANGFTLQYQYDANNNLTQLTYPDGNSVTYTYDALNRLTQLTDWLGNDTDYHYDAAGRMIEMVHANGITTTYSYDHANRLIGQTATTSNGDILTHQDFVLDPNGNRILENRTQPQAPTDTAANETYQYNPQKTRLETITDTETNKTETFTYNHEGQTIDKSGKAYTYDTRHRLIQQGTTHYHYDATDNRLKVERAGTTIYYIYDSNNNLLAEANESKQITRHYLHDSGLHSMIQDGKAHI